ncbi:MAG: hypothetical protein K9M10_01725 [Candidatus Pacebacteria bacterium]|nr:hypothetical protein [Candidatus Paceibacterota bacterium]MCF7857182.1 hypothetical protein [Candidatus Paceibacterota bacterium]
MKNFKKEGFRKGGDGFGGRPKFGGDRKSGGKFGRGHDKRGGSGGSSDLFPATCSSCKKSCEVPFRPSSDKPVYCRDCFMNTSKKDSHDFSNDRQQGGNFSKDSRQRRDDSHTYRQPTEVSKCGGGSEIKMKIEKLEMKIDRILELLADKGKSETIMTIVDTEITSAEEPVKKV